MKVKFVAACVLLTMIPFYKLISNAEGNFKSAEVKKISEKRRRRLDIRDGIDRKSHEESFV